MRRGGELVPELGQAEQAYPWAAMRVFVYAVKHCKVQQGVVKFIGFVFANIAALNSEMWSAFQLCTTKIRHEQKMTRN